MRKQNTQKNALPTPRLCPTATIIDNPRYTVNQTNTIRSHHSTGPSPHSIRRDCRSFLFFPIRCESNRQNTKNQHMPQKNCTRFICRRCRRLRPAAPSPSLGFGLGLNPSMSTPNDKNKQNSPRETVLGPWPAPHHPARVCHLPPHASVACRPAENDRRSRVL